MKQTADVPVPQVVEEIVHAAQITHQERFLERSVTDCRFASVTHEGQNPGGKIPAADLELGNQSPTLIITPLRQRDSKQRFLSTSVERSLIDDDEDDEDDDVDDVEAERTRVRMMIKVLRL